LAITNVTGWSTFRIDAPAAGDKSRGTVTEAVAAAPSVAAAAAVGCVGLLFFEHEAAVRHTTPAAARRAENLSMHFY
jgi:hypothetical protein